LTDPYPFNLVDLDPDVDCALMERVGRGVLQREHCGHRGFKAGMKSSLEWHAQLLCLATVFLSGSCTSQPTPADVLLISLDAVRADHLGVYGDQRNLTPNLDAFARQAVVFDAAFTPEPWTLPAHTTMLTGLHPSVHGVNENQRLADEIPTLAEAFSAAGYGTTALVSDVPWMDPSYGQYRGFTEVRRHKTSDKMVLDLVSALADAEQPTMVFAHFYDAHSDSGVWPFEADVEDRKAMGLPQKAPPCAPCGSSLLRAHNEGQPLNPDAIEAIANGYAASLRSLDRRLGTLFSGLKQRNLLDQMIIVITADHGEELTEHGRFLHDQFFDEVTRVPLLIRLPNTKKGRCDALVTLADLAPTIAALSDISFNASDGVSAASLLEDCSAGKKTRSAVLFDTHAGLVGLRTLKHSLIGHGNTWRLHDLTTDPGQRANINQTPQGVEALPALRQLLLDEQERLAQLRAGYPNVQINPQVNQEQLKRLKALGYINR
jgi:choline-sulfatase